MLDEVHQGLCSIFEAMEDGIYIITQDYTVQFMNSAMVRDFGEGTGKLCYSVINRSDEICPWCKAKEVFGGEIVYWEHYVRGLDRSYYLIEMPFKKADGTVWKVSMWRDVTKRKTREEDYKRLFEHVGCGVYVSSKEGRFLNANKALLDMLGYESKEEFLQIDITKDLYLRSEDRRKFQKMIEQDGHVIDYEVDFKRKDGTPISVLLTGHVRYDQNGNVLGYEGINVDQTQRKQMEKELKKTEEFLDNVINSSVNPIVVADMKGVVLLMNESAKDLIGYRDVVGASKMLAEDFYPPGGAKSVMDKLRSQDYGGVGKLHPTKVKIRTPTGEEIPMEMTASIIYEEGKEVATMAIFQDLRPKIESEKRLEKTRMQLVQSDKLASIGRLAASVAHEINNPLGGILMYSHLVLEELPEESPSCENLKKVIAQAERCKRVVKGLLDFSRQGEPKIESVNVNDIVEEIFFLVETQSLFLNIDIKKALDPNLPPIKGDKSQLQQVFINLALNAAEAMGNSGKLIVESTLSDGDGSVEIKFTDNGRGIPPEDMEKIFEPFFTTKSDKHGTGLGLAVSHGIITKHKGTISVDSKTNEGTTFTIRLPISET